MLGVGSRVFFRLHYHDAREMAGELSPAELTVGMRRILPLLSAADAQLKLGLSKVTTYLEHRLRVE